MPEIWVPGRGTALKSEVAAVRDPLGKTLVETGLFETGTAFTFVCPVCGKKVRSDQRMEPACTGPSWTNDHPLEVMELVE